MPRKRVKSKKQKANNLRILTDELYESICREVSMYEHLGDYESSGFKFGYYFTMFDKNDPEVCREVWGTHKEEVIKKWKTDYCNAGKRPFLWWIVEAPEPRKLVARIKKYSLNKDSGILYWPGGKLEKVFNELETEKEYLERLNLLEPWELKKPEQD